MVYNNTSEAETTMLARIKEHVPGWDAITDVEQLSFRRLSGLSNACYKVTPKEASLAALVTPNALLYRKKVSDLVDKEQEAIVFESMSA
jgi:hypothetical protein